MDEELQLRLDYHMGKPGALEKLIELYEQRLRAIIRLRTGLSGAHADDLLQELARKLTQHRPTYKPERSWFAWASTILKNLVTDDGRKTARFVFKIGKDALAGLQKSGTPLELLVKLQKLLNKPYYWEAHFGQTLAEILSAREFEEYHKAIVHYTRRDRWPAPAEQPDQPEVGAGRSELRQAIQDCLNRLPQRLREILIRKYWDLWTSREIANVMTMTTNTINGRYYQALASIKRCLTFKGFGNDHLEEKS